MGRPDGVGPESKPNSPVDELEYAGFWLWLLFWTWLNTEIQIHWSGL